MFPQPPRRVLEVRLEHRHRSRRLTLTPLVDVVFILLIFFILETRFLREGAIGWSLPADGGQAGASPLTLLLFDERWLWIGDERVAVPAVDGWPAFCRLVMTAAGGDAAVLRPGPAVRLQHLVDLSGGLRSCGLGRIAVQPLEI